VFEPGRINSTGCQTGLVSQFDDEAVLGARMALKDLFEQRRLDRGLQWWWQSGWLLSVARLRGSY
jgi:hypothetical protein